MFTEILKIIPKLDSKDLARMVSMLNSRFMKVAKKFGKGLVGGLTGGGILAAGLSLVDKILNPLKETQEAIDRSLKTADDVVTNAKQFNTSSGKLFKLIKLGESTGLDQDNLVMLIQKFQTAVAEAGADPTKATSVRNFVGREDTADSFFEFIQQLQKMNKNDQILVQKEVFGEKQITRMADFLQTDFGKQTKLIGALAGDKYSPSLNKLGDLNDLQDQLTARRGLNDSFKKGRGINEDMIRNRDRLDQIELDKENARINSYTSLATISEASTQVLTLIERGLTMISDLVIKMTGINDTIKKFSGSRLFKGIFGGDK